MWCGRQAEELMAERDLGPEGGADAEELKAEIQSLKEELMQADMRVGEARGKQKNAEQRQQWCLQESRQMVADANEEKIKMAKLIHTLER
eukprot:649912-Prorocentrum_minimum.AAC.1